MAFYYVKDTGTATGDGGRSGTKLTGAWSVTTTEFYSSIVNALAATTSPVSGDFILCSSIHDHDYGTGTTLTIPEGVVVLSMDDANREDQLAGALETCTTLGADFVIEPSTTNAHLYIDGVSFHANDTASIASEDNCSAHYKNATIKTLTNSASDYIRLGFSDGIKGLFDKCTFTFLSTHRGLQLTTACEWTIRNSIVTSGSEFMYSASNAGGMAYVYNTDLSGMSSGAVLLGAGASSVEDVVRLEMTSCKLPASVQLLEDNVVSTSVSCELFGCDIGDGYHYFAKQNVYGLVKESTAVKRTGGATYDSSNGFSTEYQTTDALIPITRPLSFKLGYTVLDLTSAKTLTFHFLQQDASATPTGLTDQECWIEVVHPDSTDNALGVTIDSRTTGILDTGSTLTTSTETWTGTSGNVVKQQIAITTPIVSGMLSAPITIYLHLAKDVTVDATSFFVCPKPVVT